MSFLHKPLELITEADIRGHIENQVPEGRTLDYKEALPTDNNEFRYDVTSLANAAGGELIIGIRERREGGHTTGEPEDMSPINQPLDPEILRLEQILQTNISPRLRGVRFHAVRIQAGGHVLLIRVPKSWRGLHLVKLNESCRFYSRNSKGKYIMDADEIGAGFVAAEAGYERIRKFRQERIEQIRRSDTPVPMSPGPKVILHLIPFSTLDPTIEYELDLLTGHDAPFPIYCDNVTHQYNFDGKAFFRPLKEGITDSYVQFFRNGIVEACTDTVFRVHEGQRILSSYGVEKYLIQALQNYLSRLKLLSVPEPFALGVSAVRVNGWTFQVHLPRWGGPDPVAFREERLVVPEIRIDSYDESPHKILHPAFNRIWNASGRNTSPYYSEDGEWIAD
jgi:hypothetical protein